MGGRSHATGVRRTVKLRTLDDGCSRSKDALRLEIWLCWGNVWMCRRNGLMVAMEAFMRSLRGGRHWPINSIFCIDDSQRLASEVIRWPTMADNHSLLSVDDPSMICRLSGAKEYINEAKQ